MRNLLIGVFLLALIGIAGFLYRNMVERHGPALGGSAIACTLEAKLCPDGTSVGRSGPSCAFAPCPAGNVENAAINLSYALPAGYVADTRTYVADPTVVGAYQKAASTTAVAPSTIVVRRYPIEEGQNATQVMLANATLSPSGMPPKDASAFTPKPVGARTFSSIIIERFEGTVDTAYFLPRAHDVLRFDIVEQGVASWTDAALVPDNLPEHQALLKMLATIETGE